jgi:Xaa-Pro aminopeptidase
MENTELGALIPRSEFLERQQRVAEEAAHRGLDGVVAWSKCGGTYDAYADAVYLANHYTAFPHIRDLEPHWSARGHAAVIIPVHGEATLVVDMADYRADLVIAPDVRYSNDVVGEVAAVLRDRGISQGRVGLSGVEFMSWKSFRDLSQHLPGVEFVPADDLLDRMRMLKSEAEIDMLRVSGRIGAQAFEAMMEAVTPGQTEADAVAAGVDVITRAGGALYTALVASGPHDAALVWSALPGYDSNRQLEVGEMFHVDMYAPICGGYLIDYSRSTVVGGRATVSQREVLDASVAAVEAVIEAIDDGATAGDLARAGEHFLDENGFRWTEQDAAARDTARNDLNFPAWGHGFGLTWEPPWLIEGDETPIVPGMCLAIERHVGRPGVGTAAFEQNVVVLESGPEVLSTAKIRWW